jgi:hypothetical protein
MKMDLVFDNESPEKGGFRKDLLKAMFCLAESEHQVRFQQRGKYRNMKVKKAAANTNCHRCHRSCYTTCRQEVREAKQEAKEEL